MQKNYRMFSFLEIFNIALFFLGIISFLIANFFWNSIYRFNKDTISICIIVYGWLGIIVLFLVFKSWKKVSGFYFSPYTIFFIFMLIFNYGQFLMWALGIHYIGELGESTFIRYMDSVTLLKIEMVTIVGIIFFHLGAVFIVSVNGKRVIINNYSSEALYKSMRIVSSILLACSFIIVMYDALVNLKVALEYGYSSIYYGEKKSSLNPVFKYISYMFFPSLVGIWIGNKFSKRSFYFIQILFIPYMIINMLAGDRGSWIYYLIIFIWCYINFIAKPKVKSSIKVFTMFSIIILITSVLVRFREIGFTNITGNEFEEVLQDLRFVFVKPIFEMGQSARVLGILIQDGLDESWTYGNSYAAAFFGMILPRVKVWFGYPDFYLENWISQSYLALDSYGVGFSITAEAYLNGGLLFSPVIMTIIGMIMGKLLIIKKNSLRNPYKLFFVLTSLGTLTSISRGSIELSLRIWFFGVFIPFLLYMAFTSLITKSSLIYRKVEHE